MAIQAIIMAGGAGTRLRPLTCACPKPLAPLCGAPIMDYTLQLLRRHGFNSANVTLWYRPQDIKNQFGSQRHGVKLTYTVEDRPVGTAGSVLLAVGQAKDTVLVLSGDGLTSVDLDAALAFHRQRQATATLVLQRVDIPLAYGVVMTDDIGPNAQLNGAIVCPRARVEQGAVLESGSVLGAGASAGAFSSLRSHAHI